MNGDGYADVIVGAPGDWGDYVSGWAYVIFGKPSGFSNIDLDTLTTSTGFRITGAPAQALLGSSVSAAGDVNGDGYPDLLTGVGYDHVWLLYGREPDGTNVDLSAIGSDPYRIQYSWGRSGYAAGDVNGDGLPELLMGARFADYAGRTACGTAYVFFPNSRQGTYTACTHAGDVPKMAVGAGPDGNPLSGVWLDFNGGSATSTEMVTVYGQSSPTNPVSGLTPPRDTSDLYWKITTNRTGWSAVAVTIQYPVTAEPYENDLRIYKSDSSSGPWTRLDTTLNTARHEVSVTVSSLSWFALGKSNVLPLGLSRVSNVSNAGPDDARDVVVSDMLAGSTLFASANVTQGSVVSGGASVTGELGTIARGGSAQMTVTVIPQEEGPVGNTAGATSMEADPDTSNNIAETTLTVILGPGPDLAGTWQWATLRQSAGRKWTVAGRFIVTNRGDAASGPTRVKFYLSEKSLFDSTAVYVGLRRLPVIAPGESLSVSGFRDLILRAWAPAKHVIAVVDPDNKVAESNELNNTSPHDLGP